MLLYKRTSRKLWIGFRTLRHSK